MLFYYFFVINISDSQYIIEIIQDLGLEHVHISPSTCAEYYPTVELHKFVL